MAVLSWDTPEGRKEHRLGTRTQLGRSPLMDICVPDPGVSGAHATIIFDQQGWFLEDAGSTNGTFVNEQRQSRCALRDGDVIRLGSFTMTFIGDMQTDASTMLWRKGVSEAPVPLRAEPAAEAETEATTLRGLLSDGTHYSRVSAVDSRRYDRAAFGDERDPEQVARRLDASYEISRATAATLDPSEILDRVLGALFEIFEQADRAFIVLVDPESHEMHTAAMRERTSSKASGAAISRTALMEAMDKREAVLCRDAAADERFARAQSIMSLGIRSMMIAPLLFRDEVLGAVHIDSITGVREFTHADLELLSIAAGQVAGCLANARLHEKVVAAERLAAVGQTVAGLSHCVKNILQGIKGGGYILAKGIEKADLERVRSGWEMVERNNAFMEELVYDLLSYSKPREPQYTPADLNELCSDLCDLSRERARQKGVELAFEPAAELGVVDIDPTGIRRCVLNLIGNAVDACEEGGAVTVQVRAPAEDEFVRIIVRDTGCGMSEESLAKLFTVFFSTKGSKGTGLGLPVTQKIVEEHGGRIDVESQEGKGTAFTICLPPTRPDGPQKGGTDGGSREESAHCG